VNNIRTDLGEIGLGGMNWIGLAQDRDKWRALVNTVMNFLVPLNAGKFFSVCTTGGVSRRAQLHRVNLVRGEKLKFNKFTRCL
jgi:hypothetical protein